VSLREVVLSSLVVAVLAIGLKVRGLKPNGERWIFKGDKNTQHAFLRREVKPSAPCCKILQHVAEPYEYERDIS
jgi:hypothetical protein